MTLKVKEEEVGDEDLEPKAEIKDEKKKIIFTEEKLLQLKNDALTNPQCSYCLDIPGDGHGVATSCAHIFCKECIDEAIQKFGSCPVFTLLN